MIQPAKARSVRILSLWLWSLDTRLLEFALALVMLTRGLVLVLPNQSMGEVVYGAYLDLMPEGAWAALHIAAGLFALAGLFINGNWHRSPVLRISGAIASLLTMVMLATTFFMLSPVVPSLAATVYATLAACSFWCCLKINAGPYAK